MGVGKLAAEARRSVAGVRMTRGGGSYSYLHEPQPAYPLP